MKEIEVGHIVGWGSDHIYAGDHYAEGRVVFRERDNLVILREDIVEKHPHINPFTTRKVFHVWLVEGKNEADEVSGPEVVPEPVAG